MAPNSDRREGNLPCMRSCHVSGTLVALRPDREALCAHRIPPPVIFAPKTGESLAVEWFLSTRILLS